MVHCYHLWCYDLMSSLCFQHASKSASLFIRLERQNSNNRKPDLKYTTQLRISQFYVLFSAAEISLRKWNCLESSHTSWKLVCGWIKWVSEWVSDTNDSQMCYAYLRVRNAFNSLYFSNKGVLWLIYKWLWLPVKNDYPLIQTVDAVPLFLFRRQKSFLIWKRQLFIFYYSAQAKGRGPSLKSGTVCFYYFCFYYFYYF